MQNKFPISSISSSQKKNEDDIKFKRNFKDTINSNKRLHWMVTTLLSYGNCSLDAAVVLKFKIKEVEDFFSQVFGVPVHVREADPIGNRKDYELNRTFIAEISEEDMFNVRQRFFYDLAFQDKMIGVYEANKESFSKYYF